MRSCIYLLILTYLLTYIVGCVRIKPAISPKRLEIKATVTINGLYKVVHGLSIAAKMYKLE